MCPERGCPIGRPVAASHTNTLLSTPPEAMRVPSGLNATAFTFSAEPDSGSPTGVAASHTRTVVSKPPDTIRVLSGLNATLRTHSGCPVNGLPSGCPFAASHTRIFVS